MTSRIWLAALSVTVAIFVAGCVAWPTAEENRHTAEAMVATAFPGMPEILVRRSAQDQQQKLCSGSGEVNTDAAAEVARVSRESIKAPKSGRYTGNWRAGEKLAYNGVGGRIRDGRVEKVAENGGLCSNCHVLDPREVNAGNLGPSLSGYGVSRGSGEAIARYTYEKIFDGWAVVPCSKMPRLGHNGFLTPDQITDLVAYLLDPASPVNAR